MSVFAPMGTNSLVAQETPTGTVNGSTTVFTTLQAKYVTGTLEVFLNGVQQTKTTDYTETNPAIGTFTFTTAPVTGDAVRITYQYSTNASGNSDTVDGFHASSTATASTILPLNASSAFPGSAITQVTTNRRNNSGNIVEASATIQTGWIAIVPGAVPTTSATITFPVAFTNVPIVVVTYGGDTTATTSTLGLGGNTVKQGVASAESLTTTSFLVIIASKDSTAWAAGNTVYAQWIAIGI